jgi:hypothetical protein
MTLLLNPPLIMTGAMVFRISAWRSGSLLISRSARLAATGSLPITSRKYPDNGGALVRARVSKNCRDAGVNCNGISNADSVTSARASA